MTAPAPCGGPPRSAGTRRRSPAAFPFLLLLHLAVFLLAVGSTTTPTTASAQATPSAAQAAARNACAATIEGCLRCSSPMPTICTRCRPNSIYDSRASKCKCIRDFGTLSQKLYKEHVLSTVCKNKGPNCKGPDYAKTIAGKCVRCSDYGNGVISAGGECTVLRVGGMLETQLTIVNNLPDPAPTALTGRVEVKMGVCGGFGSFTSCSTWDPLPFPDTAWQTLMRGERASMQGANPASSPDVAAEVSYCRDTPRSYCPQRSVRIEATNRLTLPPDIWIFNSDNISFDSYYTLLFEGMSVEFELGNGRKFRVTRHADSGTAKKIEVTLLG